MPGLWVDTSYLRPASTSTPVLLAAPAPVSPAKLPAPVTQPIPIVNYFPPEELTAGGVKVTSSAKPPQRDATTTAKLQPLPLVDQLEKAAGEGEAGFPWIVLLLGILIGAVLK